MIFGIIAEYNPFHLGHKYQINEIKKNKNAQIVIIMSGDFVQRGECSVLDKYERAKTAVKNGADLIIELPYYFSLQSAEIFANGAIKILNEINIIDRLSFGFECKEEKLLSDIASFQIEFKDEIDKFINTQMKNGNSYAVAYKNACLEVAKKYKKIKIEEDFFVSNNILSIEYIKNLIKTKSKILPYPIKRTGQSYNSEDYHSDKQLSASAIRKAIFENKLNLTDKSLDKHTVYCIENAIKQKILPDEKKIMQILKYKLLQDNETYENIVNYENGFFNLLKNNAFDCESVEQLAEKIQSKRYKKVRIKRFIYNYLLNVGQEEKSLFDKKAEYIKVLAFNDTGRELLKKIKENSDIKIISKSKDYKKLSENGKKIFKLEEKSRKTYKLFTNQNQNEKFNYLFVK